MKPKRVVHEIVADSLTNRVRPFHHPFVHALKKALAGLRVHPTVHRHTGEDLQLAQGHPMDRALFLVAWVDRFEGGLLGEFFRRSRRIKLNEA